MTDLTELFDLWQEACRHNPDLSVIQVFDVVHKLTMANKDRKYLNDETITEQFRKYLQTRNPKTLAEINGQAAQPSDQYFDAVMVLSRVEIERLYQYSQIYKDDTLFEVGQRETGIAPAAKVSRVGEDKTFDTLDITDYENW